MPKNSLLKGDRAKRSTFELRICWSGFGKESVSWEPYKTLMHAEPLHRYLRAHQMRTFIFKEHKSLLATLCVFFASIFSHEGLSDYEIQSRKGGGTVTYAARTVHYVL